MSATNKAACTPMRRRAEPSVFLKEVFAHVEEHRDRPFLVDAVFDRVWTYGGMQDAARRIAFVLANRYAVAPGARIGIVLENSAEFALLYFAALYGGYTAVPVSPQTNPAEAAFLLRGARVALVVAAASTRALAEIGVPVFDVDTDWPADDGELVDQRWPGYTDPETPFSITFTSGTTGVPKGVVHARRSLFAAARAFNAMHEFGSHTRMFHLFSMSYMAGFLNTLLCPFFAGGSVVVGVAFDPQLALRFWDVPIRYRVNTFWLAPAMIAALVRADRNAAGAAYARESVESVCVGTAPMPAVLAQAFADKYGRIARESYGLSETLFVASNTPRAHKAGTVGAPLPGARVAFGSDGEISIGGTFMFLGYLDYETGAAVAGDDDGWFRSGDLGKIDSDGMLMITGRKKDLIIRGGVNVSPRAVEEAILGHAAIADVAVIGMPHEFYGEEVVAVVELAAGAKLEPVQSELVALCKSRLNAASVPARFIALDQLPKSSNGKVQKARLREMLGTPP